MEPLTLTMAELAERWQMSSRQALAQIVRHALPAYFYFDGLVFDFADKWHRAHGEAREATELDAHRERLLTVESDLQRQGLHKRGLLKLTQWEARLGDEDLRLLQVEADRLNSEVARLSALLEARTAQRQQHVRNGLLRLAPKALGELASRGEVAFPQFAYLPSSPAGGDGGGQRLAAKLVAIEDGFPQKTRLTEADICVATQDVRDVQAAQPPK